MADQKLGGSPNDDSNFALIRDGVASYLNDVDPEETAEWMESLDGLLAEATPDRARFLMLRMLERATAKRVALPPLTSTDYVNTIPTSMEPDFPGDEELEKRYRRWMRWNAAIMCTARSAPKLALVDTSPPMRPLRRCMKSVSTTFSAARTTQVAATRCFSRVTPHPACTPAHS